MAKRNDLPAGAVPTRTVEVVVALAIMALGLLVVYDSHRVGVGWADDGPRSGYFPNIIGWILMAAGVIGLILTMVVLAPRRRRTVTETQTVGTVPTADTARPDSRTVSEVIEP